MVSAGPWERGGEAVWQVLSSPPCLPALGPREAELLSRGEGAEPSWTGSAALPRRARPRLSPSQEAPQISVAMMSSYGMSAPSRAISNGSPAPSPWASCCRAFSRRWFRWYMAR